MAGEKNLAVVVTANLAQMREEMKRADAIIATTSGAMKRMSDAYDGAKTIANANAAMLQIQKLGGTTGLTENEQRKLNAALAEGIAKYQALGKSAPAEMVALRDATAKAIPETNALGTSASSLTDKLKGAAGALGLAFGASAVIGGLKSLVTNTLAYAGTIDDTSKKLGISLEATQRYKFAAEQTGASLENVAKSVLKLSQQLAGGDKGVKEALDAAGLSFASIRGLTPEQAFDAVTAAIQRIPDPMTQARVAMELFGKGGAELLPAIREGFNDLAESASVMSDATIERLAKAEDAWAALATSVTIYSGEILTSTYSVVSKMIGSWKGFFTFTEIAFKQGFGAAIQFANTIDIVTNTVSQLTEAQKTATRGLMAPGEFHSSLELIAQTLGVNVASVKAYVDSLKPVAPAASSAEESNTKLATSLSKASDAYSKAGLLKDTAAHVALLKQIAKDGGFAGDGLEKFSKVAADLRGRGAELNPELFKMAIAYEDMHRKGLPLVNTLQSIAAALKMVQSQAIGQAPVSFEATPILTSIKQAMGAVKQFTIGEAPEIAKTVQSAFSAAFSNLGQTIIGAIQGGGNIGKAIGASLLGGLGDDLGKKLAEKIGGSLGKALGSFAGPLGALLGSQLGGIFDKVFGEGAGRKDVKGFAESMGGFDALRAKLAELGDEGERLWINLTQKVGKGNTAQAAAAIKAIEDAFRNAGMAADEAKRKAEAAFAASPEGLASGFPTKAQLDKAAKDAEAAYVYMKNSGLYTAATLEEAWEKWQDALIASGNEGTKALRDINAEMKSLQDAIAEELPEYDADGVRIYGVIEQQNIDRLAKLEAEKAEIILKGIKEKISAEEEAAKTVEQATADAYARAVKDGAALDTYLRDLFKKGYTIPISFAGGGVTPGAYGGAMADGGSGIVNRPTWFLAGEAGPERYNFTPMGSASSGGGGGDQTIVVQLGDDVIVRHVAHGLPRYLKLIGAQ